MCGAEGPADCNDEDAAIRPGAPELCDGIDTDCDGEIDNGADVGGWFVDADADGYGYDPGVGCRPLDGASDFSGDCDDNDASVSPASNELCNGVDDDCDGDVEDYAVPGDFPTIQEAVAVAADGDVICVEPGTYSGGIVLTKAVTLSGSGIGSTVVTGGEPAFTLSATATITGMTVSSAVGGTFDISAGSPSIHDVAVSSPTCGSESPCSGLLTAISNASPTFERVEVRGVLEVGLGADVEGGVIAVTTADPVFIDLLVVANVLRTDAVSGFDVDGGLISLIGSPMTCTRCQFVDNEVLGEHINGGLFRILAESNPVFTNIVVAGNAIASSGADPEVEGGMMFIGPDVSVPTLQFADITGNKINSDVLRGGLFFVSNSGPAVARCGLTLRNTALINNDIDGGEGRIINVETDQPHGVSTAWISVFGNQNNDLYNNWPGPDPADGNLELDASYTDVVSEFAEFWDLTLLSDSLLIDAGDPSVLEPDGSVSDIGSQGGPDAFPP